MLGAVTLSELCFLKAIEPLRRRSGGEGCKRSENRRAERFAGYGVGARGQLCLEAVGAVSLTSAESVELCKLFDLPVLFKIVEESPTYSFEFEQEDLPTPHERAYLQWFVWFAQDDLWTGELIGEPSALIVSAS